MEPSSMGWLRVVFERFVDALIEDGLLELHAGRIVALVMDPVEGRLSVAQGASGDIGDNHHAVRAVGENYNAAP
jgi:hypothetical protein